jgi:hypothetical protein
MFASPPPVSVHLTYGAPFDFYFIVVSKVDNVCDVYKLSQSSKATGLGMLVNAAKKYKQCKETGIWTETKPELLKLDYNYSVLEV